MAWCSLCVMKEFPGISETLDIDIHKLANRSYFLLMEVNSIMEIPYLSLNHTCMYMCVYIYIYIYIYMNRIVLYIKI